MASAEETASRTSKGSKASEPLRRIALELAGDRAHPVDQVVDALEARTAPRQGRLR
jgi:hypothetical protein